MKTTVYLFISVLTIGLFSSCNKENKTVPIKILLTDNPVDYESVNVEIKGIQVKMDKDDAGWINIASKSSVNVFSVSFSFLSILIFRPELSALGVSIS